MSKTVLVEVRDHVATVTFNRADASNALNLDMGKDLLEAALQCEGDPNVRAVVVTGAGKHFCFGGDLRGMAEQGERVTAYLNELTTHIHAAIGCFTRMRAPVIAAVNGTAAGGGVGLVCMTDLAIAGKGTKFSLAYTGVALAPDCSTTYLLPRIVGRRRALELMLTNRLLSADEALQWGLVNQVVEDAEVLADSAGAGCALRRRSGRFLRCRQAPDGRGRPGPRRPDGARRPHHRLAGGQRRGARGRRRVPRQAQGAVHLNRTGAGLRWTGSGPLCSARLG